MRVKLLVLGSVIVILGASYVLFPKAVVSQSANNTQPFLEIIDGMPVHRLQASFTSPTEIDGLISQSALIVIGQVEQSLEESESVIGRDSDGEISSFASFANMKVKKVFKGDANLKNQTIKIGQALAILNDKNGKPYIQAIEDVYPLQKGKYLFFLERAVGIEGYFPIGLFFGRHNLDGTDTSEERINAQSYQTVRKLVRERFKDD